MVTGNKNHQLIQGWIQNHTENHSKKLKSQADPTCVNFTTAAHNMTQGCLYTLPTISGHFPDESLDGVMGDLLPDLDYGISELLDSLRRYLAA